MNLRVLQVMSGGDVGGAEMAFVDICIALHQSGCDLKVVMRPNDTRQELFKAAGIRPILLPFGGILDLKTRRRLKQIIRAYQPHVVQTWMNRGTVKTPTWQPVGFKPLPKFVKVARLGGYYKLKYYKGVDYFVANTPDIRAYLIGQGVPSDRVEVIYNFATVDEDQRPLNRAELDTPDDAPLFLALGRLHPNKALDTLLEAMALVPGAYLWIAGEGDDRAALEQQANRLGLKDRVKFLGWRTDRGRLFATADYCVFPSRAEPFGNVGVQAWANKTPLVTTASEGPRQYVTNGKNALMVDVDDVDALAKAMRRVMAEPELCEKLIDNGYAAFEKLFSKDRVVKHYLDYYQEIARKMGVL